MANLLLPPLARGGQGGVARKLPPTATRSTTWRAPHKLMRSPSHCGFACSTDLSKMPDTVVTVPGNLLDDRCRARDDGSDYTDNTLAPASCQGKEQTFAVASARP